MEVNSKKKIIKEDTKHIHKGSKEEQSGQIVLSTRVRVARNLSGFKFSGFSINSEKKEILKLVKSTFFSNKKSSSYTFSNVSKLSRIQRGFFIEKHILSPEMAYKLYSKGLIFKNIDKDFNEFLSILINEKDHIRIQSVICGLNIQKAYSQVLSLEKILEKKLKFAYDKDFGYLTSSPVNLGTALKISVLVHVPGIIILGKVEEFIKKLNNIGCIVKGFSGENSEIVGNILQISNQVSLGKNEQQLIEEMNAICLNIIDEEKEAITKVKEDIPLIVEDSILRSYGMFKYAKILSYYESIELLSMLKIGIELELINDIKPFNFYNLITSLGDYGIILSKNLDLEPDSDQLDKVRMDILRKELK